MATLKLSDIAKSIEAKYGDVVVEVSETEQLVLRPFMRLGEKAQKDVARLQAQMSKLDDAADDVVDKSRELMISILTTVAEDVTPLYHAIDELGGTTAAIEGLLLAWTGKTQPGEASPSAS